MINKKKLKQISRLILQNKKRMIKELDIKNLCSSEEEYNQIIIELVNNFNILGLSLIRTTFQGNRYYVLTAPGKDDSISPSMYGTLGLIIALYNEIGSDIELSDMKKIFKELWADIESLISNNYLQVVNNRNFKKIEITPIGKATFKNVLKELDLKKILLYREFEETATKKL